MSVGDASVYRVLSRGLSRSLASRRRPEAGSSPPPPRRSRDAGGGKNANWELGVVSSTRLGKKSARLALYRLPVFC